MAAAEQTLLTPAQARSLTRVWSGGHWRVGMTRDLAVALVKTWLKSQGFYPDGQLLWLPKPGRDATTLLKEAPVEFHFPACPGQRWKISGTRALAQYRQRNGYKTHASESLYDFASMLLVLAAEMRGEAPALKAAKIYELKQAQSRAHNQGYPAPSPSRARVDQCLAEAWRRTLAGHPAGGEDGAPLPWLGPLLWSLGWGDRWRFWEGDSYLTEPPAYLFTGGQAKQAFWYQDDSGRVVSGRDRDAVVCIELLSHEGPALAARTKATVIISTAGKGEPVPVLWGQVSCARDGALRGSGVERRVEGGDPDGHAGRAWSGLVAFYRSRQ